MPFSFYNKMLNQTEDHLQVFRDLVAQQEKISVKISVLYLSFWKLVLFELFNRIRANAAERVFLTSLSLVSFQVPRNTYMFIAIMYMLYMKRKGPIGQHSYRMFSGCV